MPHLDQGVGKFLVVADSFSVLKHGRVFNLSGVYLSGRLSAKAFLIVALSAGALAQLWLDLHDLQLDCEVRDRLNSDPVESPSVSGAKV